MAKFLMQIAAMTLAAGHVDGMQFLGRKHARQGNNDNNDNTTLISLAHRGKSIFSNTLCIGMFLMNMTPSANGFGNLLGAEQAELACEDNAGPCADFLFTNDAGTVCQAVLQDDQVPPNSDQFWWQEDDGVLFCPGIFYLTAVVVNGNNNFKRIVFPDLEHIESNIDVSRNVNLEEFNFPNLRAVGTLESGIQGFTLIANPHLQTINMENLQYVYGNFLLLDNPNLQSIDLRDLVSLGSYSAIIDNPNLQEVFVNEADAEWLDTWCSTSNVCQVV